VPSVPLRPARSRLRASDGPSLRRRTPCSGWRAASDR
jgi:hypothetical protein